MERIHSDKVFTQRKQKEGGGAYAPSKEDLQTKKAG
jgi:hypothetical protein